MAGNFPRGGLARNHPLSAFECLNLLCLPRIACRLFRRKKRGLRVNCVRRALDGSLAGSVTSVAEVLMGGQAAYTPTGRILSITSATSATPSLAAVRSWGYREFLA